jgi:hypothetical protein
MDPSGPNLWAAYLAQAGEPKSTPHTPAWHFADNEIDARDLPRLGGHPNQ